MAAHDLRSPHSNHDDDDNMPPDGVNPNPKDKDDDDHPRWWMDPPPFDHKAHHPLPSPPDIGSGAGIDGLGPGPVTPPGGATITSPPSGYPTPASTSANETFSWTGSDYTGSNNTFSTSNGTISVTSGIGTAVGQSETFDTIPETPSSTSGLQFSQPTVHVNTGIAAAVAICSILLFVIAVLLFARSQSIRRRRRMTTTTQAWASRRLWFSAENAARESHGPSSTTGWDFGTETSLSMRQSINDFATVSGHSATMSTSSSSGVPSSWGAFGLSRPQSALSSWTRSSSRVATSDTSSR